MHSVFLLVFHNGLTVLRVQEPHEDRETERQRTRQAEKQHAGEAIVCSPSGSSAGHSSLFAGVMNSEFTTNDSDIL